MPATTVAETSLPGPGPARAALGTDHPLAGAGGLCAVGGAVPDLLGQPWRWPCRAVQEWAASRCSPPTWLVRAGVGPPRSTGCSAFRGPLRPVWLLPLARPHVGRRSCWRAITGNEVRWRGQVLRLDRIAAMRGRSGWPRLNCRSRAGERHEPERLTMMKTLFLHPALLRRIRRRRRFSRYQAKREIRSFWYPTWLAQPAALVPMAASLIDAPPANISLEYVTAQAKEYELAVIHTSSPSFPVGCEGGAGAEGCSNPALRIGFVGAKVAVQPDREPARRSRRSISSRATSSTSPSRRSPKAAISPIDRRTFLPRCQRHDRPQQGSRDPGRHGPAAVRDRSLQTGSADRGLLYRLPQASRTCLALHRPRLQIALHLLPVAADRRRPQVSGAQPGACRRGNPAGEEPISRKVREFFFDDDTFTDDLPRAEAIARELGQAWA